MFVKKTIEDIDCNGKTVLVRVDFNVPIIDGKVSDDYRIKQALPTLQQLRDKGAKLVLIAHLGRPEGRVEPKYSLKPLVAILDKLLDSKVAFIDDCIGEERQKAIGNLKSGDILLTENLRFHPGEEANDTAFAEQLAKGIDMFVQDGFGVVHRSHASTEAITHYLPSVAGLLLKKEVDTITEVMNNPKRPLMAIIGGAKIADKIELIRKFIAIADIVAVGGAMANTFLEAKGISIGESLADKIELPLARDILNQAEAESKKRRFIFNLPYDSVVATAIKPETKTRIVDFSSHVVADIEYYPKRVPRSAIRIAPNEKILDIGPFSGSFVAGSIQLVETVVWNGTMGVTEVSSLQGPIGPFSHGTELVIEALLGQFGHRPYSLIGGGDTVGYIESRGLTSLFDHVSTGGGASLELMAGRILPGVDALGDKK